MDEKTRALLGDREAQEAITARGELLPCPFCGSEPDTRAKVKSQHLEMAVVCFECGTSKAVKVEICDTEFREIENAMIVAAGAWNHRPPLLTPEQMEARERMEGNHDE